MVRPSASTVAETTLLRPCDAAQASTCSLSRCRSRSSFAASSLPPCASRIASASDVFTGLLCSISVFVWPPVSLMPWPPVMTGLESALLIDCAITSVFEMFADDIAQRTMNTATSRTIMSANVTNQRSSGCSSWCCFLRRPPLPPDIAYAAWASASGTAFRPGPLSEAASRAAGGR
jgi:hypothetical protein